MTAKIKVIHLIHQLGAGGAENGIINLTNHINNDQFETAICTMIGKGPLTHRLDRERTTLFEIDKGPGNDISLVFKLNRLFKSWRPHVVHTHAWGTLCEGFLAAKLAGVPVFIHGEHGTIQMKKYNIFLQHFVWKLADQVLSVSFEHAKQLSRTIGIPLKKITVIPNGVDSERFHPQNDRRRLRSELNCSADDILIGTVGRLVAVKNQQLLIRSFSKLKDKHPNVKLVIAGDGPLKENLLTLVNGLDCAARVFFLGRRPDIPAIMAALDIFVLPSHNEGMSNTILEAMSSGLPIVATDVGGNSELVTHAKNGLLVKSDSEHDLAQALERLTHDGELRREMGLRGRTRVEEQFCLRAMVSRYEQLYKRCLYPNDSLSISSAHQIF